MAIKIAVYLKQCLESRSMAINFNDFRNDFVHVIYISCTGQNKAIRLIYFQANDCAISSIYKEQRILKFQDHVRLLNNIFVYNYLNTNLPETFADTFSLTSSQHNHQTRNATKQMLNIPQVETTKYGLNSIIYKSTRDWNELISKNPNLQEVHSEYKLNKKPSRRENPAFPKVQ